MSHVLGVYLWKEWRDQRAGLLRLLIALLGLALCALLLPRRLAGDELFVACFVGAALVAYALSVGSDLLAGELARDRVRFLERLPGGLSAAFAGKLAFLAASATAVTLLGLLLALCVSRLRAGALPAWPGLWSESECLALLILGAAVLAWTFATSTWVPRSALALPVSLALLALLGWPFWLFTGGVAWYAPAAGEVELCALSCLLAAPFSAWASFALGYRHGGGSGRALAAGSAAAALALLPSWAWTGARALELRRLDPNAADFRIVGAVLGEGERYLFATCMLELPYSARMDGRRAEEIAFAVVVDLEDGTWDATRGASFRSASPGPPGAVELRHQNGQRTWLDARTAQPVREPGDAPSSGPVRPPAEQLGLAAEEAVLERCGLGYRVAGGILDPFRQRTFSAQELPAGRDLIWLLVRDGDWAAYERAQRRWVSFDPETGARADIAGLLLGESVFALAPDGRLLVAGGVQPALLSPEDGARQALAFDDGFAEPVQVFALLGRSDPTVLLVSGSAGFFLARLDLERATLRRAAGAVGLVKYLGGPDAETAYVIEDDRRIVRVAFGTDEREVLFPR